MSNVEDYNMKIEVINTITDDQIKIPSSIPVDNYIQEAENLYTWCQDDKYLLVAKGLDWTLVEDLPIRCGALREAEARWYREWLIHEQSEKIWLRESPRGYALRNDLVHHFKYAFSDDESLIGKVISVKENTTHASMIQDLTNLSVLGLANQELLTKIGFDLTQLDLATQKADELASLYAAATRDRDDHNVVKKIRDQAYTHLKEAVDLIRKCGKYAFWKTPSRLKGYRSKYLRRFNSRSSGQQNEPVPVPVEPEPEPAATAA